MSASGSAGPPRRQVLGWAVAGAGALSLAGCGVPWSAVRIDTGRTPPPPDLSREDLARFAAVDAVATALATARTTGDAAAAVAAHEAHLRHLGPLPGPVPSGSPTPSGWPTSTPTAVAAPAAAEQEAATTLLVGVEVLEPGLATLLTSIGACCSALAGAAGGTGHPPVPDVRGRLEEDTDEDVVAAALALVEADRLAGYAYGPLAAALAGRDRARAVDALHVHTGRALATQKLLEDAGFTVPAAPPAYDVPVPADERGATEAAARLEAACAQAAATLIRAGIRPLNLVGIAALVSAGRAQAAWGDLVAFPGLPELT